uniref:Uncharacterized protein n=1 Tax=Lepeophtheirus salmonis TaxID=72036 RepID=A0A0K2TRY8_LEPSM
MVLGGTEKLLARRFIDLVGSSFIFFSKLKKNIVSLFKLCPPLPDNLGRGFSILLHLGQFKNQAPRKLNKSRNLHHINSNI